MSKPKPVLYGGKYFADKYESGNGIYRMIVGKFMRTISEMVRAVKPRSIHEVGCGEGHISSMLAAEGYSVRGSDVSADRLSVAVQEAALHNLEVRYYQKSVYDLSAEDTADLVICCEVLEHLAAPEEALRKIFSIAGEVILSVPSEPLWRILNMMRAKYLTAFGNTPGHYNHWSPGKFVRLVSRHASIVRVEKPIPWTVVHGRR